MSELPFISHLVYPSPYVDSPLSSVEHEVVYVRVMMSINFVSKNLHILHQEEGLLTANNGTDFTPQKKAMPSSSHKRPLFIYIKTSSSSSYGYVMSKQSLVVV